MRQADIQQGAFYIGGKRQRIREVLVLLPDFEVRWRDIDPETTDYNWLAEKAGRCMPKTFAVWAKRKVEPEEVRARLAMPKVERARMSSEMS
jgi:hypothetical protein